MWIFIYMYVYVYVYMNEFINRHYLSKGGKAVFNFLKEQFDNVRLMFALWLFQDNGV